MQHKSQDKQGAPDRAHPTDHECFKGETADRIALNLSLPKLHVAT